MIWWWRTRALTAVTVAFAGSLAAAMVIGGEVLPLPSLAGALRVPIVFALLLPLVPIVFLWHGLDRSSGDLEATAFRLVAARDLGAAATIVLVTAILVGVTSATGSWQLGPGYLRNLIGCLGLAQLVTPIIGTRLAALAPVGAVTVSALFGTGRGGLVRWWAWPVADTHSTLAFAEAALLLAIGVAVTVWRFNRSGPARQTRWRVAR
ncbi:hypothetical protein [Salinispora cortesiana]|uniref:hypothetical protein n=1 Tax=Salinispora cortesiana TaxID=1305843 RepID=UPI00041F0876|nr:hypothetical protein [Salinispora cortesiana]